MSLKQTLKQAKRLERELEMRKQADDNTTGLNRPSQVLKPRNPLAFNPLLKKGGVHQEDNVKAVHRNSRRQTKQSLRKIDWTQQ